MALNILITGASGFIGRHVCERLENSNLSVTALVRSPIAHFNSKVLVSSIDSLTQSHLEPFDVIVNCAGLGQAKMHLDPNFNVRSVNHLLMIKKKSTRFIHLSSLKVLSPEALPFNETEEPHDLYGKTKLAAEKLIQNQMDSNYTLIRLPWVTGIGDHNLVPLLKLANLRVLPRIKFLANEPLFSFISATDVADYIYSLLKNDNHSSKIIYLSKQAPSSWNESVDAIYKKIGKKPFFEIQASKLYRAYELFSNVGKLFGKNPHHSPKRLDDILKHSWLVPNSKETFFTTGSFLDSIK